MAWFWVGLLWLLGPGRVPSLQHGNRQGLPSKGNESSRYLPTGAMLVGRRVGHSLLAFAWAVGRAWIGRVGLASACFGLLGSLCRALGLVAFGLAKLG